ncbi:hypothetical protein [Priestia megaterium]|uniref:hypothetical protein n=1 Tax=Priestia megaterium TaxID=1404 RepID=UPI0011B496EA|nr:hypothetical protein [Priestia megaterium]QDZ88638.1 hypothetical protein D0441_30820 [Priestia megaterium]
MNSIVINKLIIEGIKYKRTLEFTNKLNIISGDGFSGKSLVLKLIDYCFGKKDKFDFNVQKELGEYCNYVLIEVKINGQYVTILRYLKENYTKIYIYYCHYEEMDMFLPKIINYNDISTIMFPLLDIPEVNRIKNKSKSNEKTTEKFSFRDIMRFVYISQDQVGTKDFLNHKDKFKRYKNTPTFELMHNFLNIEANDINEEITILNNKIERCIKEIEAFNQYLAVRDATDILKLNNNLIELQEKIKEQKTQKENLLKHELEDIDNMYADLNNESLQIDDKIKKISERKRELTVLVEGKRDLMKHYQKEHNELLATIEVMYKIKLEEHIKNCPLCNSKINHDITNKFDYNITEQIKKQLEIKINSLKSSITRVDNDLVKIEKQLSHLFSQSNIIKNAIKEYKENIKIPYLSDLEVINKFILEFENQYNSLRDFLGVHNKIKEINQQKEVYEKNLKDLERDLTALEISEDYKEKVLNFLNKEYRKLLNHFKYPTSPENDFIDERDYMPYYNRASVFSHESGGLLMSIQVAYIGSLILQKIQKGTLHHPGLLMLDSLSKYIGTNKEEGNFESLDPASYEEIYKFLMRLSENIQVFIVDNTPPLFVQKFVKYKFFRTDMRGLIDPSKNEK